MKTQTTTATTPLMAQYARLKSAYPEYLVLLRIGDFYETFEDDAIKASQSLDIVLTKKNNGSTEIPITGFPFYSIDNYLPKLIRAGHKVVLCEQLESPKK